MYATIRLVSYLLLLLLLLLFLPRSVIMCFLQLMVEVEVLKHSIVSEWEGEITAADSSVLEYKLEAGNVEYSYRRLRRHKGYGEPCPVSQDMPVTGGVTMERWDRVLWDGEGGCFVEYGSPTLTPGCQL